MRMKEEELWKSKVLPLVDSGKVMIREFTVRWANLMEERMLGGASVADVATQASSDADQDGLSAHAHAMAVGLLHVFWELGEELRQWHNLKVASSRDEALRANPGQHANSQI